MTSQAAAETALAAGRRPFPFSRTLVYSSVYMPLSVVGLPLAVWVPPVYAELGVPLTTMGLVLLAARWSDAFTDPLIGWLSDRTRTRMGRRKPYMLIGTPLMMVSVFMLFVPPESPSPLYLFVWVSLLYLAATIIDLPYFAWGAELSPDYSERTRIVGVREQFHFAGTITSSALPLVLITFFAISAVVDYLRILGDIILVLLPLTVLASVALVPERPPIALRATQVGFRDRLLIIARNRPFLRLMFCYTVSVLGSSMTAVLSFLFVKHYILAEDQYPLYLLLYYLASVAGVPVWRRIADRLGKHRTFVAAILWFAFWASFIPFIPPGYFALFLFIMCMKGSAVGALLFIPYSMAADVVDIDIAQSGEERTGVYFAIWGLLRKGAAAIGTFVALTLVAWYGFDATLDPLLTPETGGNPAQSKLALALLYSIIPAGFKFLALPFLIGYPLTEARQKEIRADIEARAAQA